MAGLTSGRFASAAEGGPIAAPDMTKCHKLKDGPTEESEPPNVKCCPPTTTLNIVDFKPGPCKIKIRPAAHSLDSEYIAKYNKAMELMRALPEDDPRSWIQQANVHCAYCNGAYDQVGFPDQYIQVHNCWLFFPFHRWYLYFYEKILGKLIGDPTFALPFWNWDHPDGYPIPSIFVDQTSALYDKNRNQSHLPPAIVDLDYTATEVGTTSTATVDEQTAVNLKVMYTAMVSGAKNQTLFFGKPYLTGYGPNPGPGTVENIPHTPIHIWCGDNRRNNWEDMGHFYSAGRDPLFYSHHANVDRMWNLWKKIPGGNRTDITDSAYLNSTFLFYDENAQLVRVKVKDSLDSRKLGYVYEDVDLPWLSAKPKATKSKIVKLLKKLGVARAAEKKNLKSLSEFPIKLDKTVSTVVKRPKKSRSKFEKEVEEEVLVIQGIEYDRSVPVKFDVYINDEDEDAPSRADKAEFAGSFASVPQSSGSAGKIELNLGISDLLEDLGADDDDSLVVTLVPKSGIGKVKIDGIKIDFLS